MTRAYKVVSSIFRRPWQNEASLTEQLIDDGPAEVELSNYRRVPGSGSESPSGLLNGEGENSELILDLDLFFGRLYNYYGEKGMWCYIIKWVFEILSLFFIACFTGFFLLVVDWHALLHIKCGIEAFEAGNKTCDLAKEAINQHPLTPFTFTKGVIVGSIFILIIYGIFRFMMFIAQFRKTLEIRNFYYNSLGVTDREIQATPWSEILNKVVQSQKTQKLCVVKDLSAHEIMMRIMRKDNYLIGMINKGVLAFPICWWIPGAGPVAYSSSNGQKNRLFLPKTLEWVLNWLIFQSMFDSKFCLRDDFIANPSLLKKRFRVVGVILFLISPCLVIFMFIFLFLRHAEQFYNHPRLAFSRNWSNLSKWMLREFNEANHFFKHRIGNSVEPASNYLSQFPSPLVSIIARFVSFVSGGFTAILIIIAILDESLLEGHIFGRNLIWYAAVFGAVTALSRASVSDDLQVLDPEGAMAFLVQHTHYMPRSWRGIENCDSVRTQFATLFQYIGMMLLEEIISIFLTPFLLIFRLPERVDDILQFISDFTVDIEGVGNVCSFSAFDFENHGNMKYGSPCEAPKGKRSSQGKMEKSFLSFQNDYPSWESDRHGEQFLSNLLKFKEKQMRLELHGAYKSSIFTVDGVCGGDSPCRFPKRNLNPKSRGYHAIGNHLRPGQLMYADNRTHPYLLDAYYINQSLPNVECLEDYPPLSHETPLEPSDWKPYDRVYSADEDMNWNQSFSGRQQSHMEASTSVPLFRNSFLHRREGPLMNQWWARSAHSSGLQTSFLEPPNFLHHNFSHHNDDVSESIRGYRDDLKWKGDSSSSACVDGSRRKDDLVLPFASEGPLKTVNALEGSSSLSSRTAACVDGSEKEDDFRPPFASEGPLRTLNVRILPRSNDPVE